MYPQQYKNDKCTETDKKKRTAYRLDCYSPYIHSFPLHVPKLHGKSVFPFHIDVKLGHVICFGQWAVGRSDSHSVGLKRYQVFVLYTLALLSSP